MNAHYDRRSIRWLTLGDTIRIKGVAEKEDGDRWIARLRSSYGVPDAVNIEGLAVRTDDGRRIEVDASALVRLSAAEGKLRGRRGDIRDRDEVRGTFAPECVYPTPPK